MSALLLSALLGILVSMFVNWLGDHLPPEPDSEKIVEQDYPPVSVYLLIGRLTRLSILKPSLSGSLARYPLTELVLAGLFMLNCVRFARDPLLIGNYFYIALLVLVAVIDIEHRLILNEIMFPAFLVALVEIVLSGRLEFIRALAGYALAQIIVFGFYLFGGLLGGVLNRGRGEGESEVAFGFGDVTLATFCGLILGSRLVPSMLIMMVFAGGVLAVFHIITQKAILRREGSLSPFPYGPAIILSAGALLLYPSEILTAMGAG